MLAVVAEVYTLLRSHLLEVLVSAVMVVMKAIQQLLEVKILEVEAEDQVMVI